MTEFALRGDNRNVCKSKGVKTQNSRNLLVISPETRRSRNMRAVRAKDTKPERLVRSAAHALGLRFRLHRNDLPGRPDLVFPRWKTIIFVNGCFWHQHAGCAKATLPMTNQMFWKKKLERNVERDRGVVADLDAAGWTVLIIWECEVPDPRSAKIVVARILGKSEPD